jgi:RND family efflux transporter MFP subunit
MKRSLKYLPIIILIACGSPKGNDAIKKAIDQKKVEKAKIEQQISDLEKKISINNDPSVPDQNSKLVAVEQVKLQLFTHYIEVQGSLDGDNNVAVYPEAMGVVQEIYVKAGQKVVKGQELARLDDAAIREQIKGLVSNLELATTMFNKTKSLWDQNIGSEVQYLQAKTAKEGLEAQLASVKSQQEMMHIKSPINGIVEEAQIKLGQTASPQLPVFRVVSFNQIKVITDVAEAYASKIKVGDKIVVNLPDIKKEYNAEVTFASNFINQVNRTFRVEALLKESDASMKANMVAVLKINDYKNDNAIILPINYVQKDQKGNFVYVAEKSGNQYKASKRTVTTGQIYNGIAEITSGLNVSDNVITLGYLDVEEGEMIRL